MFHDTPIRCSIIEFIKHSSEPVDFFDIKKHLDDSHISANKTTIYRQLNSLLKDNTINEIDLGEGKKRYENRQEHHHHLYCTKCHKVACIKLNDDFSQEEKIIYNSKNFLVKNHKLDFFGLCEQCQESINNKVENEK